MSPNPNRRRFQFGLRGLFFVVSVAGIISAVIGRSLYLNRMAAFHEGQAKSYSPAPGENWTSIDTMPDWHSHKLIAREYRRAVFRPWRIIDESQFHRDKVGLPPPDDSPGSPLQP